VVRRLSTATAVSGVVQTDAEMAKLTVGAGDTVLRGGKRLVALGRDYVAVTGAPATVTVSGDRVTATGPATNAYRVFAPSHIARVTVNGTAVGSCREGSYLTFPCPRPGTTARGVKQTTVTAVQAPTRSLAATGGAAWTALGGMVAIGAAVLVRRRAGRQS
jgi:hypothetical protein